MTPFSPTSSFPVRAILYGIGGGLASAALFYSAVRGSVALSIILLLLTPLPSLIAGIGWGLPAAIAAAVAGLTAMAASVSPVFAVGYALALGVPVVGITHLVYLASYGDDAVLKDWYPVGRILAAIALYGAALPILVISLAGGSFTIFEPELARFLKQVMERAPIGSGWRGMTEPQLQSLANLWTQMMPAAFSSYWTFFIAINLYLAGRIAGVSGLLVRPWPNLHWMAFPSAFAMIFGAALLGLWIGGAPRVLGMSALGAFVVAYLLQGLSVVHAIAKERAPWLRFAIYATLMVAGYVAVPITALVGLLENLMRVRARVVPLPPTLPLGSV